MTDRFGKRMKRKADRQALEQYVNTLRKRLVYRMERQTDRQACENDGQIERQASAQDGRT